MSKIKLTQENEPNGKIYLNDDNTAEKYVCLKKIPYNENNKGKSGYFFGQGKDGDKYGYGGLGVIAFIAILIAFLNYMEYKDGTVITNIIHIFGFSFYNIIFLLLVFVPAPLGYQFWLGRCKNDHPGKIDGVVNHLLAAMPFIASIILVIYPASVVLSVGGGSIPAEYRTALIGIAGVCGLYSALEYWPSYIKNYMSHKSCQIGAAKLDKPNYFHLAFFAGLALIAGLVLVIAGTWIWMTVTQKIAVQYGLNPIGILRNLLISLGLVLTNIFGGLRIYEVNDHKIDISN
jgi:hypothetical protein|tara:strand:+ start:5314 stop:6180 length:867 start_codon:yes stop_codon:yes gene_type:complete